MWNLMRTTIDLHNPLAIDNGIVLRRWRASDAPSLAVACDDPEIAHWLPVPSPYTIDAANGYLAMVEAWWERGEQYAFAISPGDTVLGAISLRPYAERPSIGYWLAASARGRGIMTRAVEAIVEWGRQTLDLSEVWIFAQPANEASCAVARRAGFIEQAERVTFPDGKDRAVFRLGPPTTVAKPITAWPSVVGELAETVRFALGDDLLGLYLYGSAATGGFDPSVSDIDLLAVTRRPLAELDLPAIEAAQHEFVEGHTDWRDRIEIVYVASSTMASFWSGGPLAVISPGESFHVTNQAELWLENWYLVRETGIALVGPAASDIVPPISLDEFLTGIATYAEEVRARSMATASPRNRAYAVLTMCRAYRTIEMGETCSKQEAADWVRERLPEWSGLIDEALACRLSGGTVGLSDEMSWREAERFVQTVGEVIAKLRPVNEALAAAERLHEFGLLTGCAGMPKSTAATE